MPATIYLKPFFEHTLGANDIAELTALLAMKPAPQENVLSSLIGFGGGIACLVATS